LPTPAFERDFAAMIPPNQRVPFCHPRQAESR
jgi:hypothetical protein